MDKRKLMNELIRDEGMRLRPYHCTAGALTIGMGRNLDANGISEDEAELMARNDIDRFSDEVFTAIPFLRDHPDDIQRAIVNMAFNMGTRGLLNFRNMLSAIDRGDYDLAATEALNSRWARQVGRRASRIAELIRNA